MLCTVHLVMYGKSLNISISFFQYHIIINSHSTRGLWAIGMLMTIQVLYKHFGATKKRGGLYPARN